MLFSRLWLALAAVPALATALPPRKIVLPRQVAVDNSSSVSSSIEPSAATPIATGTAATSTSTATAAASPSPSSNSSSAVLVNTGILNALPFPFDRIGANNATVGNVSLPASPTYTYSGQDVAAVQEQLSAMQNATVVAYQEDFLTLAGNATVEAVFTGENYHEAPVYLPKTNQIFLTPDVGSTQVLIDLNTTTLANFTASPPVENINGGTYVNGSLIVTTNGGNETNPAVFRINLETNESSVVTDNYYGLRYNSLNDIVADAEGNFWFNDPNFGWLNGFNPNPPQLETATYFYNATSGLVRAVVDQIGQPNGLVFSPDGKTLYVTDTSASSAEGSYPQLGSRDIYAFEVANGFATNRRLFFRNPSGIPDGIKVDTAGNVWSVFGDADTGAIEAISPDGQLLGLIQLPEGGKVSNLVFVPPQEGETGDSIWAVGSDTIWKISGLNVTGVRIGW
ncbi:hypothetical protein JCM8097_000262 [Rhodosporidiobolus ruineniae]